MAAFVFSSLGKGRAGNDASPAPHLSSPRLATMKLPRCQDEREAMLGVFAEFETNLRRERQMEGIAKAKAEGVYKGRKPTIDPAEVRRMHEVEGLGATEIARKLGIARTSVYRVLEGKAAAE